MKYEELSTLADSFGLPNAYYEFENGTGVAPPFLVWHIPNNNDVFADDANFVSVAHVVFELYTDTKDFELENRIEALIPTAYAKTESYIDSEHMHISVYEFEVTIERN